MKKSMRIKCLIFTRLFDVHKIVQVKAALEIPP